MNCSFCDRELSSPIQLNGYEAFVYECKCCGTYALAEEARHEIEVLNDKYRICHLLVECRLLQKGKIFFHLTPHSNVGEFHSKTITEFINCYPKNANELLDRVFINISSTLHHPADKIIITSEEKELLFSRNGSDMKYILRQFENNNFISGNSSGFPYTCQIEAAGWERLNYLRSSPSGLLNQAFVAMWFSPEMNVVYEIGIKPAVEENSTIKCMRVDAVQHNNKICDQIIAEIRKSKFMIADFTGNRGGVYFEAGYAQGMGIPVIWIVQSTDIENLHFDTRQYNHIVYDTPEDLKNKLKARIEATILNSKELK